MDLTQSRSPGLKRFTSRLHAGRSKSFPLCLSIYRFRFGIPSGASASSWRSMFWSFADTRMYPKICCSLMIVPPIRFSFDCMGKRGVPVFPLCSCVSAFPLQPPRACVSSSLLTDIPHFLGLNPGTCCICASIPASGMSLINLDAMSTHPFCLLIQPPQGIKKRPDLRHSGKSGRSLRQQPGANFFISSRPCP